MLDASPSPDTESHAPGISWRVKLVVALLVVLAAGVVLFTNRWLSERFTEVTRNSAELRLAFYSGNVISELQRNSVVPLLLARDPELIGALERKDYSTTSARLISFQAEIGAASIILLDGEGRVVGATNRNQLGETYRNAAQFIDAQRVRDIMGNRRRITGQQQRLAATRAKPCNRGDSIGLDRIRQFKACHPCAGTTEEDLGDAGGFRHRCGRKLAARALRHPGRTAEPPALSIHVGRDATPGHGFHRRHLWQRCRCCRCIC